MRLKKFLKLTNHYESSNYLYNNIALFRMGSALGTMCFYFTMAQTTNYNAALPVVVSTVGSLINRFVFKSNLARSVLELGIMLGGGIIYTNFTDNIDEDEYKKKYLAFQYMPNVIACLLQSVYTAATYHAFSDIYDRAEAEALQFKAMLPMDSNIDIELQTISINDNSLLIDNIYLSTIVSNVSLKRGETVIEILPGTILDINSKHTIFRNPPKSSITTQPSLEEESQQPSANDRNQTNVTKFLDVRRDRDRVSYKESAEPYNGELVMWSAKAQKQGKCAIL